jgi:hypothetical protein
MLLLALGPATAFAWGDGCKLRADRAGGVDAKGVEKVVVRTGAGDMKVIGRSNAVRIEARGVACAAKQELLDATQISVRREGNVVYVETDLPQNRTAGPWATMNTPTSTSASPCPRASRWKPSTRAATRISRISKALTLQDSSGDLEIHRDRRPRRRRRQLGRLDIDDAGSVRVRDSSGDIESTTCSGDATWCSTARATSHREGRRQRQGAAGQLGGIRVEDVKGNVDRGLRQLRRYLRGSVNGNFTVSDDSSGTSSTSRSAAASTCRATRDDDVE